MPMLKRIAGCILLVLGGLAGLLALASVAGALIALVERHRHGPGLLFADVEIFALSALVLGSGGGALCWIGRRCLRRNETDRH